MSYASLTLKAAVLGESRCVARAMKNANDHKVCVVMHVIDGVGAREADA